MTTRTGTLPASVDDYLAALGDEQRAALERLRRIIQTALPRAEECISYRMPAFRLNGKVLVWFAAASRHCAFFPGAVVEDFRRELSAFSISKGTIRFQPGTPIPAALVRKLIKARIAAVAARGAQNTGNAGTQRRSKRP